MDNLEAVESGSDAIEAKPPQPITYVTYDENGNLDGYYIQVVTPEHEGRYIQITAPLADNWLFYRANTARDGLEPIPPQPPTIDQLAVQYSQAVQNLLENTARSMGYDNIVTACTYADEPAVAKYQAEGRALRRWRSLVWQQCYNMLEQVKAGAIPIPTQAEVVASLPALAISNEVAAEG